jgi:hypothetical protein
MSGAIGQASDALAGWMETIATGGWKGTLTAIGGSLMEAERTWLGVLCENPEEAQINVLGMGDQLHEQVGGILLL